MKFYGKDKDLPDGFVQTHRLLLEDICSLSVEVGSNYPKGGDSGHGGRTLLRLTDEGSSDLRVSINGQEAQRVDKVTIILGGDAEALLVFKALKYAVKVLSDIIGDTTETESSFGEEIK